jgi:hypothetical protein
VPERTRKEVLQQGREVLDQLSLTQDEALMLASIPLSRISENGSFLPPIARSIREVLQARNVLKALKDAPGSSGKFERGQSLLRPFFSPFLTDPISFVTQSAKLVVRRGSTNEEIAEIKKGSADRILGLTQALFERLSKQTSV